MEMMTTSGIDSAQVITPWLAVPKLNPRASLRLFCFPYAGGGASIFHRWSRSLPQSVDVCAVQYPGREHRWKEPPVTRLSDLVQALRQALAPYMDKPFVLYGHSMGGLVGFELARLLRKEGGPQP